MAESISGKKFFSRRKVVQMHVSEMIGGTMGHIVFRFSIYFFGRLLLSGYMYIAYHRTAQLISAVAIPLVINHMPLIGIQGMNVMLNARDWVKNGIVCFLLGGLVTEYFFSRVFMQQRVLRMINMRLWSILSFMKTTGDVLNEMARIPANHILGLSNFISSYFLSVGGRLRNEKLQISQQSCRLIWKQATSLD
jgi:hypothetical protein